MARWADPGLSAVTPGSGLIMIAPVSVCHQVSTTGQRSAPITLWYQSQALGLIGSPTEPSEELVEGVRATVAERIGKFARPKRIIWADDLPKTRSGKIMRRLLRDIAEGRAFGDVTTLRDPEVMKELEAKIATEQADED